MESILIVSPYVENIMVHADPFHSYAVAIVVVSQSALEHWAQSNGIQYDDFGKLSRSKEANNEVLLSLQKVKLLWSLSLWILLSLLDFLKSRLMYYTLNLFYNYAPWIILYMASFFKCRT